MHPFEASVVLFDFSDPRAVAAWSPIDDRVMGGISRSRLRHDSAGHAVFEGVVSLEQKGGFASVRSQSGPWGLAGAQACVLTVRGAGQRFKLSLLVDDGFDGVNYQATFTPSGADWQVQRLPVAGFKARATLNKARLRAIQYAIGARQ